MQRVAGFGGQLPLWGGAVIASLLEAGERVEFTSEAPALRTGLEQGPMLGCTHSPVTPGAKAARDPGAADQAGGPGRGLGRGEPAGATAELRLSHR